MDPQTAILVVAFGVLLVLGAPIAVALGISALLTLASLAETPACYTVAQRLSTGIASFPLLAIPFFVLAGALMGEGGMARRLVALASAVVGPRRGALSYVTTITCMLFGAISGSATAAVSSVGGMLIPEMVRKGYGRPYSVAVTTTAATTGLVIPPSNIMIVYALVAGGVSVAAIFLAGVLPGVLIGLAIMVACRLTTPASAIAAEGDERGPSIAASALQAAPTMFLVMIVLGGILGGVFSPTEASAIAVLYALVLTVVFYREIKLTDLPRLCVRSASTTAVIFLLIGASQAMSWVMTIQGIPQSVSDAMLGLSENPVIILLTMNALLLVVGTFMDMTPAVLIFTPIFLPVATELGMHPVHFGVMIIVNLCIGLCTPPVGTCLFIGCGVGQVPISQVVRPMLPFFAAMLAALIAVTFIPALSLWLPRVLHLID
ncbi:Sialic acid TRAP transporter permease protein SiaT [Botrimarina colliarenosi]|uniref:Sialic acid TRAP transporter permease protein SiaT n=1 Tax=Botrimarina colliarenosi TaxID=2528001 RepID=A0A5C6AE07_9BACT|nr:TRAP transporter large permease [Botrimarina colliarenosi]TWT97646.1 Sialic acid TRAP transporter permease protein SiaT [Botrimarina colliarenosi]